MLVSTKALRDYALMATDGEIGRCKDFLFDDQEWVIRYMVVDTGLWLPKQRVLISPISLASTNWHTRHINVRLTMAQIEDAPLLDEDAPVSRQFEREYADHYGYAPYWRGAGIWGSFAFPGRLIEAARGVKEPFLAPEGNPHLRSMREVRGYRIRAVDGEFGHVEDFIIDDSNWKVAYIVIDTRNWFPSPNVIVPPEWTTAVDWADAVVQLPFTRSHIKNAPEYDPHAPVNRVYETRLYDYYGRPYYQ